MDVIENFTPADIEQILRIKPRMVDYLCRTGLLHPSISKGRRGRGRVKRFSYSDLIYLRSLKALLEKDVSVKRIKHALGKLKRESIRSCEQDVATLRVLVTDGVDVFRLGDLDPEGNPYTLENLTQNGQWEFAFVLDQSKFRKDVDSKIREKLPLKKASRRPG